MYDNLKLTEPGEFLLRGIPSQFLERDPKNFRMIEFVDIPNSNSANGLVTISAEYVKGISHSVTSYGEKIDELYDIEIDGKADSITGYSNDGVAITMTPEHLAEDYRKFQQEFYTGKDLTSGHSAYSVSDAEVIEVPSSLVSSQGYIAFREGERAMPVRFDQNVVNLHFERGGMKGIMPVSKDDFIGLPQVGSGETTSLDAELLNKTDRVKLRLTKPLYRVYGIDGIDDNEMVLTPDEVKNFFSHEMQMLKDFKPRSVAVSPNDFFGESYHPKTGEMFAFSFEGDLWNKDVLDKGKSEFGTLLVFRDDVEGVEYEGEKGFNVDREATNAKKFLTLRIAKPYFQVEDGNQISIISADEVEKYYKEKEPELQSEIKVEQQKVENVYLHDVSEKLIHPTSRKNVYSVSIADPESTNGFGSILVHSTKIYQKNDANGAPVPGKKSIKLGPSNKTIAYSIKGEFGEFITNELMPLDVVNKWQEGRKAFFANLKGANQQKGYDKQNDKELE